MSRKREQQKAAKQELARQLGVPVDRVPEGLRERPRTTTPTLKAALRATKDGRGLLRRAPPLSLVVGLFLVDGGGPRLVRARVWRAEPPQRLPGDAALTPLPALARGADDDAVTYARPARFVVVARAVRTHDADALRAAIDALQPTGGVELAAVHRAKETVTIALVDDALDAVATLDARV